jgi:hypothetical protein
MPRASGVSVMTDARCDWDPGCGGRRGQTADVIARFRRERGDDDDE